MFAPIPPWDGFHPILVHVPLALFPMAVVFVLLAIVWRRYKAPFAISALITMLFGVAFAILTVESGEAAKDYALNVLHVSPHVAEHIDRHMDSGMISLYLFSGLTAVYLFAVLIPILAKPNATKVHVIATLVYLVVYGLSLGQLAHTGYLGGTLVHEHGVHAPLGHAAGEEDEHSHEEAPTNEQS